MTDGKPQVRVDVGRVIPIFADEALVISRIKSRKMDGKNSVEKEGYMEIIFLDQLSQPPKAISRVVLSKNTAEGLHKAVGENLSKMGTELKSKKMPKQKKAEAKGDSNKDTKYLG